MKKIGILTFCNADNYGAVLQAAALQKYLKDNNFESEFINLKFNKDIKINNNNDNKIIRKQTAIEKVKNKLSRLKFKLFRKRFLNISEDVIWGDEGINNKKLDYFKYIVGSDQVWNTDITNFTKAFYLNFIDENKISYAGSFGKSKLNSTEIKWSLEEFPKFEKLSVRERSAYEFLKSNNIDAELVCDPVFLLNQEEWKNFMKLKSNNKSKYILVYYMEPSNELKETVNYFKEKLNLSIKYICGGNNVLDNVKNEFKDDPIKFLNDIYNAEFIITNSFHAVAFSIIFKKKFVVISHSKWNSRLDSLLTIAGYEEQCIKNIKQINDNYILDGDNAYRNMSDIIKSSKDFINNALK